MIMDTFSLAKTTQKNLPRLPFKKIKEQVLGKKFSVSLVFIGEKRSRALNKELRGKDSPANILSIPLSSHSGEIYITPSRVEKEAKKFSLSFKEFLLFIFIHGLLHLKGCSHGSTMEKKEEALFATLKRSL